MAEWFAYIVICGDGTLYSGVTTDPERRCREHNLGRGARYTRSRRPVRLAYLEPCDDRSSALRRERQLKALSRREKMRLIDDCDRGTGDVAAEGDRREQ